MRNHWLYFLSILGLSTASIFIRLAAAPLEIIGFWRLLLCALCFAPFAFKEGFRRTDDWLYTVMAGVFFFLHLWCFFYASQNTSIANSMILYSTNPLFTALGALLFFKQRFTWRLAFAYILAIFGIYQLVASNIRFVPEHIPGDIAALLSGILLSAYVLAGNKSRRSLSNVRFSFVVYLIVAVLFGITAGMRGYEFFAYPRITWWSILALVIFPTLLGHAIFMYLLKHLNINLMSCGKLMEPALAALMAYLLFHEKLGPSTWIAFLCTAGSVLILFLPWQNLKKMPWQNLNRARSRQ